MVLALPVEMPMLNNGMTLPGVRFMESKSSGSDTLVVRVQEVCNNTVDD